jgi:hypothetical protein
MGDALLFPGSAFGVIFGANTPKYVLSKASAEEAILSDVAVIHPCRIEYSRALELNAAEKLAQL